MLRGNFKERLWRITVRRKWNLRMACPPLRAGWLPLSLASLHTVPTMESACACPGQVWFLFSLFRRVGPSGHDCPSSTSHSPGLCLVWIFFTCSISKEVISSTTLPWASAQARSPARVLKGPSAFLKLELPSLGHTLQLSL